MLDTRTTSSGGTWRRRVRLALVGSAVALLASACRSGEVCVRPLEDLGAPGPISTLPEPPPGQDDAAFVLELSAAATELEYAGVVELEILLRSIVDEELVFPPESLLPASDGQGLFLETWIENADGTEFELFRSWLLWFSSLELVIDGPLGVEKVSRVQWDNSFLFPYGPLYESIALPARHALRAWDVYGLDHGARAPGVTAAEIEPGPLRFLLEDPGRTYWLRVVRYDEGEPIVASNWIDLTVESDVSTAREEAVRVVELLGLTRKISNGISGLPFSADDPAAVAVIDAYHGVWAHLPLAMQEWLGAVSIFNEREYIWKDPEGRVHSNAYEMVKTCREFLAEMSRWTEIPRTLPRRFEGRRKDIERRLDWAREESERQRRATWGARAKELTDPATTDTDR